jgi:TPR repeat protein
MDPRTAAHYFKLSADQDDFCGQYSYGICLLKGIGVPIDQLTGIRYLKLSVDQGYAPAQLSYGFLLSTGNGIPKDASTAAHDFKLWADEGVSDGVPTDKSAAAHYFKLAADQEDGRAQCQYALCLMRGVGVSMSQSLARKYLTSSARQGVSFAQYTLARQLLYVDSSDDGLFYMQMAADAQYLPALLEYGHLLECRRIVPSDGRCAADYFKMAADQGSVTGCLSYARHLSEGDEIEMNLKEAEQIKSSNGIWNCIAFRSPRRIQFHEGTRTILDCCSHKSTCA